MPRLVYLVTHPMTAMYLLQGQLKFMADKGFDVSLITSPSTELVDIQKREGVSIIPVPIKREISPAHDTVSLIQLIGKLRELKPDIVNASTPKAGFLGMLSARLTRVPVRVYLLRGLRGETKQGMSHRILRTTERITAACAHKILCVSESLRRRYLDLGFASDQQVTVLGKGSSNGVDASHFKPVSQEEVRQIRRRLDLSPDIPTIGFVGRLVKDKGIVELLQCFDTLLKSFSKLQLVLVGDFENGDPLSPELVNRIRTDRRIVQPGFVRDPALYYHAMDILLFPSYREGFPNAPLEASASGIPVVGFKVTGTIDAIEDGMTGRSVTFGDVSALVDAARSYLVDPDLRARHGKAGRERVLRDFQQEMIWYAIYQKYLEWLNDSPFHR